MNLFGLGTNKTLKKLMEQPNNNYCVDCGEPLAANVDCTHYTFVCVACSAIHREIGDKIKSVGVSDFTHEEISRLKDNSNDEFNHTWMSGFQRGEQPLLPAASEEARREFIYAKYRQKRWHRDSPRDMYQSRRSKFPTEEENYGNTNQSNAYNSNQSNSYSRNSYNFEENDDYNNNQSGNLPRGDPFANNNSQFPQRNQNSNFQNQQPVQYSQNFNGSNPNFNNNNNNYNFSSNNNNGFNNNYNNNNFNNNNFNNNTNFNSNNYNNNTSNYSSNASNCNNNNHGISSSNSAPKTGLAASAKNAPFQKHKSNSSLQMQQTQQVQQPQQIQQPPIQQFQQQSQTDVLLDLMSGPAPQQQFQPQQQQFQHSQMQNQQFQQSQQFQQQNQQFQQQNQQFQQQNQQFQQQNQQFQQQNQQYQQTQMMNQQYQQPQQQYQQQQMQNQQFQQFQPQSQQYQQPPLESRSSFPRKKGNSSSQPQLPQQPQFQSQPQIPPQQLPMQSPIDDIIDFSSAPPSQPQLDIFGTGSSASINDDEILSFSNMQVAAAQQQEYEKRRQLKEAMGSIQVDNSYARRGSVEQLRNAGLGVQDSPSFMAKQLIASGYCSQPPNQQPPRMQYGSYQGYQQNPNPNQYYRPQ